MTFPRPVDQLFHVGRDPDQLENLADDAAYAPVIIRMKNHLQTWQTETCDSTPTLASQSGKKRPLPGADRGAPRDQSSGSNPSEPGTENTASF